MKLYTGGIIVGMRKYKIEFGAMLPKVCEFGFTLQLAIFQQYRRTGHQKWAPQIAPMWAIKSRS